MGIGAEAKHTEVFSTDEEDVLWKTGTLGTSSPSSLMNAVFYNNGKILCLRGGEEHRKLKISQFRFDSDEGSMLLLLKMARRTAVEVTKIRQTTKL